jgi:flagellar hook-associated protein 2
MATSSTSPASIASLTAPATFTGVSKFATSLQQVLTRAVGIASLPLNLDQAALTKLNTVQSDIQGLDTVFSTLQQSISSLQSTVTSSLLTASLSDSSTVSATVGAGAVAGTYTIAVGSLGAFSTALSNAGSPPVTDPTTQGISSSATFNLIIGAQTPITITPASSDLQDLAAAINTQSNGQVQATLVNVGSNSSPDYRLSLQATSLGTDAIDLTDASSHDLIQTSTAGTQASYQVDGSSPILSDSRTVNLSPGLTVNLLGQSAAGKSTTISVSDNPSALASAFSSFAGSYNAAVDSLVQYHGQSGGALEGASLLQTLSSVLTQLGNFNNGSPASALANFGITLDQVGHLSVDSTAFTNAANANFPTLLTTLGSTTTGGFLQAATKLLNGIEDPATGAIKTEEASIATQITNQQTTISNEQAKVNLLQTNLTQQISQADATLAELESQVSYVTGLLASFTGANNTQANGVQTL